MPTAMESVFTGSITIDGERVTVRRTAGGEVWLTQSEIARLFGVFEAAVRANIRAIYRSEALRRGRTLRIVHGVELYSLEMIAALAFRLRSLESEAFRRWLLRPAGPEIRLVAIAGGAPARVRNPEPAPLPQNPYTHQRTLSLFAKTASVLFGRTPGGGNVRTKDRVSGPCVGDKGFSRAGGGQRPILKYAQTTKICSFDNCRKCPFDKNVRF